MSSRKPFRFLLTNDDGLDAPGLAALEAALPNGSESIVVAPSEECSACSHQVTTHRTIRLDRFDDRRLAVDSMPADCVRVAVHDFRDSFDWVLAGINHGANLGADVYYSGTVAAVREAALHGIPSVALSHLRDRVLSVADWERAAGWASDLLPSLLERELEPGEFWNVNFPSLPTGPAEPPWIFCEVDTNPLQLLYDIDGDRYLYAGIYGQRARNAGTDVDVCFQGCISISRLRLP